MDWKLFSNKVFKSISEACFKVCTEALEKLQDSQKVYAFGVEAHLRHAFGVPFAHCCMRRKLKILLAEVARKKKTIFNPKDPTEGEIKKTLKKTLTLGLAVTAIPHYCQCCCHHHHLWPFLTMSMASHLRSSVGNFSPCHHHHLWPLSTMSTASHLCSSVGNFSPSPSCCAPSCLLSLLSSLLCLPLSRNFLSPLLYFNFYLVSHPLFFFFIFLLFSFYFYCLFSFLNRFSPYCFS